MAVRKDYIQNTAEKLHAWTHSDSDHMHKTCASQMKQNSSMEKGFGHTIPHLAMEL